MPLAAITATLTRYVIRRYKESALYHGERPQKPAAGEPELALAMPMDMATPAEPPRAVPAAMQDVLPRRRKRLTPTK